MDKSLFFKISEEKKIFRVHWLLRTLHLLNKHEVPNVHLLYCSVQLEKNISLSFVPVKKSDSDKKIQFWSRH